MSSPKSPTPVSIDYSSLNVRDIFEQRSVDEKREIHRKINQEIERKKEDLRMLVGERYRDLIEAADTIGIMRNSSTDIYRKLGHLRKNINALPGQLHLSSYKPAPDNESRISPQELEICADLKLSLEVPRLVKCSLDSGDLIGALHLCLLYSRKLDHSQRPYQWTFLGHEHGQSTSKSKEIQDSILQYCEESMNDFDIPHEKLAECILVKNILTGSSCEEIIQTMLSKRIQLIQPILSDSTQEEFAVKISSPIHSLYEIFLSPRQIYSQITKEVRRPSKISNIQEELGLSFTPKSVTDFNNELLTVEEPPRVPRFAQIISQGFMTPLKATLESSFANGSFLSRSNSLEELQKFRSLCISIFKGRTEELMRIILGSTSGRDFWSEVLAQVFQMKCESLIQSGLESILVFLVNEAYPGAWSADVDFDLAKFVWHPNKNGRIEDGEEDLRLKHISPNLAALCQALNAQFDVILQDFGTLDSEPSSTLKEFTSSKVVSLFENFFSSPSTVKDLFLGRFATALASGDFTTTLWKLLGKNDISKLRQFFVNESEGCWNSWTNEIKEKFGRNLTDGLPEFTPETLIKSMPVAEEFSQVDGDEPGAGALKASVRVPLQISHFLHSALFSLCIEIGAKSIQSIPKSVQQTLRLRIGEEVVRFYEESLIHGRIGGKSEGGDGEKALELTPQFALQFIMDLKFILWFHPNLGKRIEGPLKELHSLIDPFDLDIISNRMGSNLKRFLFENHLTLGLLFSEESHGFIAQNFKTKQSQSIPLSKAIPSLPLLPI